MSPENPFSNINKKVESQEAPKNVVELKIPEGVARIIYSYHDQANTLEEVGDADFLCLEWNELAVYDKNQTAGALEDIKHLAEREVQYKDIMQARKESGDPIYLVDGYVSNEQRVENQNRRNDEMLKKILGYTAWGAAGIIGSDYVPGKKNMTRRGFLASGLAAGAYGATLSFVGSQDLRSERNITRDENLNEQSEARKNRRKWDSLADQLGMEQKEHF